MNAIDAGENGTVVIAKDVRYFPHTDEHDNTSPGEQTAPPVGISV
jgi:hypothetical protein